MRQRLPRDMHTGPLRLKPAVMPADLPAAWKRTMGSSHRVTWATILGHQWDGQWWQIPAMAGKPERVIHKAWLAVRMKRQREGYSGKDLQLACSLEDGLCFRWRLWEGVDKEAQHAADRYQRKARRRLRKNARPNR